MLSKGNHPCPAIDYDRAIAWVEEKINITLADDQKQALKKQYHLKLVLLQWPGVEKIHY